MSRKSTARTIQTTAALQTALLPHGALKVVKSWLARLLLLR